MSRKKDIIRTFQHLQGDERLELMCCLLDCCLPLEIRFLATYVEFVAKEHYLFLKKWEVIANSISSDSSWHTDLSCAKNRRLLCTYMALLYSHNSRISAKFVGVLSSFLDEHSYCEETMPLANDNNNYLSKSDWNELRLLLTMAYHHPAVQFTDKQFISDKLKTTQSNLSKKYSKGTKIRHEQQRSSNESKELTGQGKSEGLPASSESDFNEALDYCNESNHSPLMLPDEVMHAKDEPSIVSSVQQSFANNNKNDHGNPVIITAPHIQSIPMFAQVVQPCVSTNSTHQECNTSFPPASNDMLSPQQLYSATNHITGRGNYGLHSSSAPIPVITGRHSYAQGYSNQLQTSHTMISPTNLTIGSSPSMQSPLQSPFVSPVPSPKGSPRPSPKGSPRPSPCPSPMFGRKANGEPVQHKKYQLLSSVYDWLRSLRLHKYVDVFENHSFEMISKLNEEDLIGHGLTQGARKKLRLNIDTLCERGFQNFGADNPLDRQVPVQPEPNAHSERQKSTSFQNVINSVPQSMINGCNSNNLAASSLPVTANPYIGANTQSIHTPQLIVPVQAASPHLQTGAPQLFHCDYTQRHVENMQNPKQILVQSPPMSNQFLFPLQLNDPTMALGNPQEQQKHHFVVPVSASQQFHSSSIYPLGKMYQDNDQLSLHQMTLGNYEKSTPDCYNCGSLNHPGEMCTLETFEATDHAFMLTYGEQKHNSSS